MATARERQIQAALAQEGIAQLEQEAAGTPREKQAKTARLEAEARALCEQNGGHAWRGRRCANCGIRWDETVDVLR